MSAYLPLGGSEDQLGYLAANVGDHLRAATANVVAESPLHFERALHASSLTASQVETLQAAFSDRMMDLLETLNREGQAMKETGTGDMRIRLGGYVFTTEESKSR